MGRMGLFQKGGARQERSGEKIEGGCDHQRNFVTGPFKKIGDLKFSQLFLS